MIPLANSAVLVLTQLQQVLDQMNDQEYSKKLRILSGNTIGKHVRHILELYDCLVTGSPQQSVNYDKRKRNPELEEVVLVASKKIEEVIAAVLLMEDGPMTLWAGFHHDKELMHKINSSVFRELAYNIEHSIHHMAIIKMALQIDFPFIHTSEEFGIAPSTIRYQQQCVR
jgi:uncharacterized damage-inducible protein DinB